MTKTQLVVAVVIGACALGGEASAETKSWAAIKSKLPANAEAAVSFDVKAMRALPGSNDLVQGLLSIEREPREIVEAVTALCKIDVVASISDVSIAITKRERDWVFAFGLDGVDEAKLLDCVTKIGKSKTASASVTAKTVGALREYTLGDGAKGHEKKIYASWPAKDVVVFSGRPDDATGLDAYGAGKAASGELAAFIGKAAAVSAPLGWLAGVDARAKDGIKGGFGTITHAKGMVVVAGRLITVDATAQKALLAEMTKDLGRAKRKAPPIVAKVIDAIKLIGTGNDLTIEAAVAESELPKLVIEFLKAI